MSEEIKMQLADSLLISISDDELISKVTDTENNFIERKSVSDKGAWLQTAVAFANSCPVGFPGVLYVGVNDDGTIPRFPKTNEL
jgi:predicted HTH transcriptional regulator